MISLLKKAKKLEKQGQMNESLSVYKQALKLNEDAQTSEWRIPAMTATEL